jgi:tripartite-type tricarboxylate transporter receptor subunit TctC
MIRLLKWLVVAVAAGMTSAVAADLAQDYPRRPIRLLVPYAPGGATDIVARTIGPKITELLGQQVVIDNRSGAAGNIALELVARAQPDGYTLLIGNVSTNSINPTAFAHVLPIDPLKELMGITLLASVPNFLIASATFPAATLKDFVAYAKARPGQLNHGGPIGSYSHLDLLAFMKAAGIQMVHIPSKGGAGTSVTSLISNEVQITWMNLATAVGQIRSGRLKAYAVTTDKRLPDFPNVPTMAEAGFAGIGSNNWNGLFGQVKLPKPIVAKLFTAFTQAVNRPDVQEVFARSLIPVAISKSPEEFDEFVRSENARWTKIIKENNLKLEP